MSHLPVLIPDSDSSKDKESTRKHLSTVIIPFIPRVSRRSSICQFLHPSPSSCWLPIPHTLCLVPNSSDRHLHPERQVASDFPAAHQVAWPDLPPPNCLIHRRQQSFSNQEKSSWTKGPGHRFFIMPGSRTTSVTMQQVLSVRSSITKSAFLLVGAEYHDKAHCITQGTSMST